jgi:hypothetical protein
MNTIQNRLSKPVALRTVSDSKQMLPLLNKNMTNLLFTLSQFLFCLLLLCTLLLQPGRFSQVLVLQQSPSGGFYLRADIQRFGVGALAHNLGE